MAEWELIQDRVLSGKGVLQVPTDVRKGRLYLLFTDVIRDPSNRYLNFAWNPPRGRYGTLVFLRNKYVVSTASIDFERQCYDGINDISGQNLLAIKCAYSGILQTFFNLGNALALPSISVTNAISEYESLSLSWDEVRLVAYADTALQLRLYRIGYDVCDEATNDTLNAPITESPIEKVPPGSPFPNSEPYDGENDDGNSQPFPGDEFDDGLVGGECEILTVQYQYLVIGAGAPTVRSAALFGEIGAISVSDNQRRVEIQCRGTASGTCQAFGTVVIESFGAAILTPGSASIISVT